MFFVNILDTQPSKSFQITTFRNRFCFLHQLTVQPWILGITEGFYAMVFLTWSCHLLKETEPVWSENARTMDSVQNISEKGTVHSLDEETAF
jgi:hypothetical protein